MQEIIPDWQDSLTTVIWIVCEIRPQFAGLVYIVSSTDNCSPPPGTMDDPDSDLSQLDVLTEDSILEAVKTRYQKGKIYVSLSSFFTNSKVPHCVQDVLSKIVITVCLNLSKIKRRSLTFLKTGKLNTFNVLCTIFGQ